MEIVFFRMLVKKEKGYSLLQAKPVAHQVVVVVVIIMVGTSRMYVSIHSSVIFLPFSFLTDNFATLLFIYDRCCVAIWILRLPSYSFIERSVFMQTKIKCILYRCEAR